MANESSEVIVVGAGLSGLVAALNLALGGHEVLVLDKYNRAGGMPQVHPAVDVSPMEPGPLGKFIGVELRKPQVTPTEKWNFYIYDQMVPMDLTHLNVHCVERGSRKTALDKLLYDKCLEAGVKFEFGKHLVSQDDFARLPPGSVIATGLYFEAFEALNIPYKKVFGYIGRGKTDKVADFACWIQDYIDFAYYGTSNGVAFSVYFALDPVKESEWENFRDRQLNGQEGITCTDWDYHEGLVPMASYNNPRMFVGDKILAGTLGGMMDPLGLFGLHGALVSGKIAAMAHQDKYQAYELFRRYTRFFKRTMLIKRTLDSLPVGIKKKLMAPPWQFFQNHADIFKDLMDNFFKGLPGYKQLPD